MKRKRLIAIAILALALVAFAGIAGADTLRTVVLTVPDLCGSNMAEATAALEAVGGVDDIQINIDKYEITVTYVEYEAYPESFRKALEKIGLEVTDMVAK